MEVRVYIDMEDGQEVVTQLKAHLPQGRRDRVEFGRILFGVDAWGIYAVWSEPQVPEAVRALPANWVSFYETFVGTGLPLGVHNKEGLRAWVDHTSAGYGQNLTVNTRVRIRGGSIDEVLAFYGEIREGRKPENQWQELVLSPQDLEEEEES